MDETHRPGPATGKPSRRHLVQVQFRVDATSNKDARDLIEVCTSLGATAVNTVKPTDVQIDGYTLDHSFSLPEGFDALADAGILDELVAAMPAPPDPAAFPPMEEPGGEEFLRAFETWIDATADWVEEIKAIPHRQEYLAAVDRFREEVEIAAESSPVSREPRPEDYPGITATTHGNGDRDENYRRDHAAWQQETRRVITQRDRLIQEALTTLGADTDTEPGTRLGQDLRELAETTAGRKQAWTVLEDIVGIVARSREHTDPHALVSQITDLLAANPGATETRYDAATTMLQQREDSLTTENRVSRPVSGRGQGTMGR